MSNKINGGCAFRIAVGITMLGLMLVGIAVILIPTVNATVEPGVTTNPCSRGFIDFEEGADGAAIHSTVPGVKFTTTAGQDWLYGDWRTGKYNGKYPNGQYTSNGNLWAWLGPNQGSGRIDFTEGTANYLSLLTSTYSGITIDAYDSNGNLLANSGLATGNINTGLMTRLSVSAPGMAYVIVHDTGNYWLIDDICTDAGGVPISKTVSSTFGTSGSNPNVPFSFEPVNLGSGNYIYQYNDLFIPGRGLPLTITRSYNSLDSYNGSFGYGWTFNYNINLAVTESSNVVIMREDGRRDFYTLNPNGSYTSPLGVYDKLTKNPDGSYTLNRKDQIKYSFTSQGKLNNIIDKNGNQISLSYSGNHLTKVIDASGRELDFTYDAADRIIAITDPIGRVWSYAYDDKGNLVQYTNPLGGEFSYTYNDRHWMTSITDPKGNQIMTNTYDGDGYVINQSNALGATYTFNYDVLNRTTTETDPLGKTKIYDYDEHFWVLNETDQLGNKISYAYDENGNRIRVTNANGQTTQFAYDANGDIIQITDPLSYTTYMAYDSKDNLISMTDALARQILLEYDTNSNLVRVINALGEATVFAYDEHGQIIKGTNANGHTTSFDYDINGNQKTVIDALGNTVSFTYDSVGQLIEATDADGNKYTLTYDDLNRLISVTDPLGHTASNTYDAVGNRISFTDASGNVTMFSYNPLNKLVKVTDALGGTVRYNYDIVGNKVSMIDANGHTTNYAYDPLNRPVSIIDPLGYTTSNSYDAVGNRISFTDAAGSITRYNYDALNRLVKVTDAMGGSVYYTYDAVGNMMSMKDANGHTTNYIYDSLNRLVSIIDPLGNTTSSTYDAVGNIVSLTDANGKTTSYNYDGLSRLIKISYPDGKTVGYSYDTRGNRLMMADSYGTTNYQYDELNRLLSVINPAGQKVSYMYDLVGNRVQITYPDNKTASYAYDATNRLIDLTDRNGGITSYSYDPNGNLIGMTYPNGMKTEYIYDEDNRLIELINKNETQVISSFNYTLDAVGNRLRVDELFSERFEEATQTTTYEYDDLYRLTKVNYTLDKIVKYNYDPMGNRLSMTTTIDGIDSTIDYIYDAADRLLKSGSITYSYDNNGNLIKKSENPGRVMSYSYDSANRLISISTLFGAKRDLYNFEYDGDGNRVSKTRISGKRTQSSEYVWDVNSILPQVLTESDEKGTTTYTYGIDLISMTDPQRGEFYYHHDGLGSIRSLSDSKESIKAIYSYDAFGQIQKKMGYVDNDFLFTGEQMDTETGLIYLRARYYDPAIGRFITKDPFPTIGIITQNINRYVYTMNNPVNLVDPSGKVLWYVPGLAGAAVNEVFYLGNVIFTDETFSWSVAGGRAVGGFAAGTAFTYTTITTGNPWVGGAAAGAAAYSFDIGTQRTLSYIGIPGKTEDFSGTDLAISTGGGALMGGVSSHIFSPNVGRNPKHITTILTGKQMQKELLKKSVEKSGGIIFENIFGSEYAQTSQYVYEK
ncbi:MAG: RHS repeat-associated core domain-containing protein [Candidatus Methanoperedens sp.]|nr:RHS repeat-associated core domain-containing protein [Candidatus Methanoperedens sp.]